MEDFELTPDPKLFDTLCKLIETLRGRSGCPWDRKQTPDSIIRYLTDEVYELADAVSDGDPDAVSEELGDVLFLTLFLVQLFRENNHFGLNRVLDDVHTKMVRRHPHVFDHVEVENIAEVSRNWARIKQAEKPPLDDPSAIEGIPRATPALSRAYKMCEGVANAGFDRRSTADILQRTDTAFEKFRQVLQHPVDTDNRGIAFGDLLLSLVFLGRAIDLEPSTALSDALDRFEQKFRRLEAETSFNDSGSENVRASLLAKIKQAFE